MCLCHSETLLKITFDGSPPDFHVHCPPKGAQRPTEMCSSPALVQSFCGTDEKTKP